jgi:hypothetical protein
MVSTTSSISSHAEDQVGLRDQPCLARGAEDRQRAVEPESWPDPAKDSRNGLHVVREHLGSRTEDLGQLVWLGVEVRDQQFNSAPWYGGMDLTDSLGVEPRAAIGQIVAGDTGDGGVPQRHLGDAFADPAGFVGVEVRWLAGIDLTEVTAAGALIATDQEGGLAVFPALIDVGTAGLFADRVQPFALDQRLQLFELRSGAQPGLDPGRLAFDRSLGVAYFQAQHPATVGFHAGRSSHLPHPTPEPDGPI